MDEMCESEITPKSIDQETCIIFINEKVSIC